MPSNPSSRVVSEHTTALLRVTLDAAPLIAATIAELPTTRGVMVTFAYHYGSVTAQFDSRLTPSERDTVTLAITRQFQSAGWGYSFYRDGIDLTHPDDLGLIRTGSQRPGPATLTDALAALTAGPPEHDTAAGPTDTLSRALAATGHTALAAAWHTAWHTAIAHKPTPAGQRRHPPHSTPD